MYLRFPTLVELVVEAGAVPASPRDIPRLLGISSSGWYAYRAGTRNPGSGEEAPLLRSNAASLLAKACSAAGKAAVDPERYVANLFRYQDFLVRLDSLLPGALPAVAEGLAAAVLSSAKPAEPRPPAEKCLGALLAQDPGAPATSSRGCSGGAPTSKSKRKPRRTAERSGSRCRWIRRIRRAASSR